MRHAAVRYLSSITGSDVTELTRKRLVGFYAVFAGAIIASVVFALIAMLLGAEFPEPPPYSVVCLVAALATPLVLAVVCRNAKSDAVVTACDVGGNIFTGLLFMAVIVNVGQPDIVTAAIGQIVSFLVIGRATVVPSTARRTFLIGGVLSVAGTVFVLISVPNEWAKQIVLLPDIGQLFVSLAIAVYCSRFIYGLVRDAAMAKQLGQYILGDAIGSGGMGVVYAAKHALLQRPTAVKLLRKAMFSELDVVRFEREVRVTAQLTHPNTVAVYDYGRTGDGTIYYAMELLDGFDLETLVSHTGPLPAERVVHILRQVCGSLSEAHAAGLVHRDVKPGNILVCKRGNDTDVSKVLDFGLVKQRDVQGVTATAAGIVVGTPAYLAPENITNPDDIDYRADIYALGAVGYFLLSGRTVFRARTAVEMCGKHLHEAPSPLSQHVDGVPEDLESLILRCLAKKPEDRPPSMDVIDLELATATNATWTRDKRRLWWTANEAAVREKAAQKRSGAHNTQAPG